MTRSVNTTPTIAMTMIGTNSLAVANTFGVFDDHAAKPADRGEEPGDDVPMRASPTDSRTPAIMNAIAAGRMILKTICVSVAPQARPVSSMEPRTSRMPA
jgi:hypothetical protein